MEATWLDNLSKRELLELCPGVGLTKPQKTLKADIIMALLTTALTLEDLTSAQLSGICEAQGLATGGTKAERIERLVGSNREPQSMVVAKPQERKQQQKASAQEVKDTTCWLAPLTYKKKQKPVDCIVCMLWQLA